MLYFRAVYAMGVVLLARDALKHPCSHVRETVIILMLHCICILQVVCLPLCFCFRCYGNDGFITEPFSLGAAAYFCLLETSRLYNGKQII